MYGKKLHEIRKKLNLSQEEIAAQTNTSYRAYTSYERGDRKPSFEFLENLVNKYNVNLNWLIANSGEPFKSQDQQNEFFKNEILSEVRKMLISEGLINKTTQQ